MLKCWTVFMISTVSLMPASSSWAGYDFEPPSLRSFVRFWGIGPGPGYHNTPCPLGARKHYRCVTRGYAPMPIETDYYPETHAPKGPWHRSDQPTRLSPPDAGLPLTPTPLPQPEPLPVPNPQGDIDESQDYDPPPPPVPMPSLEQPSLNEPTPANLPQEKSVNSLIDELLREQEVQIEDVDDLMQGDASAPAPVAPTQQPSARRSSAGDNWW